MSVWSIVAIQYMKYFNTMGTDATVLVDMQLLHNRFGHLNRYDLMKLLNCTLGIKVTDSKFDSCMCSFLEQEAAFKWKNKRVSH